jgi:hypothetical protein
VASALSLRAARPRPAQGQQQFCNTNNECTTRDLSLHTAPGYDNMTGLGSPGDQFLSHLTGH